MVVERSQSRQMTIRRGVRLTVNPESADVNSPMYVAMYTVFRSYFLRRYWWPIDCWKTTTVVMSGSL